MRQTAEQRMEHLKAHLVLMKKARTKAEHPDAKAYYQIRIDCASRELAALKR